MKHIKFLILFFFLIPFFASAEEGYKGQLVTSKNSSAVYYISGDSKSYSFPNEKIYFSWFNNFDYVQNVNSSELEKYEYKGSIKYKPQNYKNLDYVLIDGTLVKQINELGIFYIQDGNKRVFTNIATLEANGFQADNAIIADISDYPWGYTISRAEEDLLDNSKFIEPLIIEIDSDQDELNNYDEKYFYHTDVNNSDTDQDGMNDREKIQNRRSPLSEKRLVQTDTDEDYLNDFF